MNKIDLLTIYPCTFNSITSIDSIDSFHAMKAYFLTRSFKNLDHNFNIVPLFFPEFYIKKHRNAYQKFLGLCGQQGININKVENVLFGSVCMMQFFKFGLGPLMSTIPGKVIRSEDHQGKPVSDSRIWTIGHYQKREVDWNVVNGGLIVASDVFTPKQDWDSKILRIHVDHNYKDQPEIFDEIKKTLFKIKEKITTHPDWDELEIYYHDRRCSIEELGHFDFKPLPMSQLSNLYGSCHISFMSHKESLGMYPIEMLSSGSVLIGHKELLVPELRNEYPFIDIFTLDIDYLLSKNNLITSSKIGRTHILKYDLDQYADKILDIIRN